MNSTDEGMLVMNVKGEKRELAMLLCFAATWWRRGASLSTDVSFMLDQQDSVEMNDISATPSTYPSTFLAIFCFFMEGALRLADPYVPFLFFGFFLLIFYLELPLLLPRSQIKQLGTLLLYLSYWSAKIKQFGQTSFSILQQKNWNMAWSRLGCWTIHPNSVNIKLCTHIAFSWKYGIFASPKQSIFELSLPIMKYETYWYRYLTYCTGCSIDPVGQGWYWSFNSLCK